MVFAQENLSDTSVPHNLQTIEIIGSKAQYDTKILGTNNIINVQDLKRNNPLGTEEMLRMIPGVVITGDMGLSNRLNIGIRGANPRRSSRVLVLEDGSPIAVATYLDPQVYYNPPPERLSGIEVIKGPELLLYGGQSIFGAVNYISRMPSEKPKFDAQVSGGQQNFFSGLFGYSGTWEKFSMDASTMYKKFDGFIENNKTQLFNFTTKMYYDFTPKSRAYFKVNYHQEDANTTYFGLTPFTFNTAPTANPFDADEFKTKRIAIDLGHDYSFKKGFKLTSKAYANNFQFQWWRQNTAIVSADVLKTKMNETTYANRFNYLDPNTTYGPDAWVRVGRLTNGRETSGGRLRDFKIGGLRESISQTYTKGNVKNFVEAGVHIHVEQFSNRQLNADSSRWSRSGKLTTDNLTQLLSTAGYLQNRFTWKSLTVAAIIRAENVRMSNVNLLTQATNPNLTKNNEGVLKNNFTAILPGGFINYDVINTKKSKLSTYSSIYCGFLPPSADFGFFTVDESGNVGTSNITDTTEINIKPETSIGFDGGIRGSLMNGLINVNAAYFNSTINNFYSPARREAFQTLGKVNIQGVEMALFVEPTKLLKNDKGHELKLGFNGTWMASQILNGVLNDALIFSNQTLLTQENRNELIGRFNESGDGYNVYIRNNTNTKDSLITRPISNSDFANMGSTPGTGKLSRLETKFGDSQNRKLRLPNVPTFIFNFNVFYAYKGAFITANYNYVSKQYSEYFNLVSETAEGGLGELPAYYTIDLGLGYNFNQVKNKNLQPLCLFLSAKNITNEIFRAGRLHRVESGVMPGGFRLIVAGLNYSF